MDEFYTACPTLKRFPVDSSDYKSPIRDSYDSYMMFTNRTGEYGEHFMGIYTLDEVKKAYMESTTEYEAAMKLFTEWSHWLCFIKNKNNKKYILQWRMEKEIRDRLRLKELLWKSAQNGNVSAQKILLDLNNKDDYEPVTQEGRTIKEQLDKEAEEKEAVAAIKDSLRLVSVNGKRKKT